MVLFGRSVIKKLNIQANTHVLHRNRFEIQHAFYYIDTPEWHKRFQL